MKVSEIMTTGVEKVSSKATAADAVKRMMELHITSLIVDKDSGDDSYGIVTRKDILDKVVAEGLEFGKVKVSRIMSKPVFTVHPDDDIHGVAKLMTKMNVRRFPVHDGHDLVGLISNSDIFRAEASRLLEGK